MAQKEEIAYNNENHQDDFSLEAKFKKLKRKLKKCRTEKEEYLVLAQRGQADLINYRKRQEEAAGEFRKYQQGELIKELLPVLDSLEAATKSKILGLKAELQNGALTSPLPAPSAPANDKRSDRNIKLIKEQLETILKNYGLRKIKAIGEKFDPNFHEAVDVDVAESDKEEGIIVKEIQKGYMLHDKVLRASKVRVSK